jgi:hypothetical protein
MDAIRAATAQTKQALERLRIRVRLQAADADARVAALDALLADAAKLPQSKERTAITDDLFDLRAQSRAEEG